MWGIIPPPDKLPLAVFLGLLMIPVLYAYRWIILRIVERRA
jgi:hypothetical protein